MKKRRTLLGSVMLGSVLTVPGAVSGQTPEGEYRFWVFATADATDTVAGGRFVLGPEAWDLSAIPKNLVRRVRGDTRYLLRDGVAPTACFGFEYSRAYVAGREFYGGIYEAGLSRWTMRGDTIQLRVYQSPDASQALHGRIAGREISGTVYQRDWDRQRPVDWLPFEAVWVGPATAAACQAVLESGVERPRSGR